MEDVLVQVLSLCSVETLTWIQCDEGEVLGLPFTALRYILHKRLKEVAVYHSLQTHSVQDLIQKLNKQQLCTTLVSDSYRSRHWKQYFLIEQFIKQCVRNKLHDFLNKCLQQQNIDIDYSSLEDADLNHAIYHGHDTETIFSDKMHVFDRVLIAALRNRYDLIEDVDYETGVGRFEFIHADRYDLFMEPDKHIPKQYLWLYGNTEPFESLPSREQQGWLQIIAQTEPKFLRHFNLTKDQIRGLYSYLQLDTNTYRHVRQTVRYLRQNELWDEFPAEKKDFCLLYTQLHDREPIDIESALTQLHDISWPTGFHWIIFALREWYNVPPTKLLHFKNNVTWTNNRSLYMQYIKSL